MVAQEQKYDTIPAQRTVTYNGSGELTAEYLSQIDSIMQAYEQEKLARQIIANIEQARTQEERSFDFSSCTPLLQGSIHLWTQRGYIRQEAVFARSNMDAASYSLALSPLAANWILKAAGVESRSSTRRMVTANLMTYALVEGLSLGLKYSVRQNSPDQGYNHSMPSVRSALAFASATILSKEYGHISPWISIGSFAAAAGSQFVDIHSNAHWLHDTFIGAGIGTLSASIGYYLTDLIYGEQDINKFELRRRDLTRMAKMTGCPSAFTLASGSEFGNRVIEQDGQTIKLGSALSAGAEGTWFVNPNFAVEAVLSLAESQVKVMTGEPAEGEAAHVFTGDNLSITHFDVAAKLSMPFMLSSRVAVRGLAGLRNTSSMTFTDELQTISIPRQTRFELGCGITYDALGSKNYSVGFSFDYRHTFASIIRNRYSLNTVWKVLF